MAENELLLSLTEEERLIVGWQYRTQIGDFDKTLMDLIQKASGDNLDKLAQVFPVHVSAYKRMTEEKGWFSLAAKKAGKQ